MSVTVKKVIEYLNGFSEDSKFGVMVVDTEIRKKYSIKDGNWLDMFSYPVLVLDVGQAHDMDEVEKQVACECEEPEIIEINPYTAVYRCKNCGKTHRESRLNFAHGKCANYCRECGQRFNWDGIDEFGRKKERDPDEA